jgi:transcriptional regulator with XRE-family HTH domain
LNPSLSGMPSSSANFASPPAASINLVDSEGVIGGRCKHSVYKKANTLFTYPINKAFTVGGMESADDPVVVAMLDLAQKRGWSQDELAKRIGATDRQTVNNWKRRGVPPKYHSKIAKVFEITVEQLLSGTPINGPREPAQTIYGIELTPEAARFAAQWQALRAPWKTQVQLMVETLLRDQAHDDRQARPEVDAPLLQRHRGV